MCHAGVTRLRSVVTSLAAFALVVAPIVPRGRAGRAGAGSGRSGAGGPGALSHFDLARKDCVGTARNTTSKVWYTVADGVLSDVYSPTIDNTNVETLQYVVTDGSQLHRPADPRHDLHGAGDRPRRAGLPGHQHPPPRRLPAGHRLPHRPGPERGGGADPAGAAGRRPARAARLRPLRRHGQRQRRRRDRRTAARTTPSSTRRSTALVSYDTNTVTNAVNRDYGVPLLRRAARRPAVPVGAAAASPAPPRTGWPSSTPTARWPTTYAIGDRRQRGADRRGGPGRVRPLHPGAGLRHAAGRRGRPSPAPRPPPRSLATYARYALGWVAYDAGLRRPPAGYPGLSAEQARRLRQAYYLSVNVVKASEDKTFPGAVVAGLGSPWGQAVSAGDLPDGKPVYFGSYREVFARDLYESFTGLLTAGDLATARATVRFLFERQQLADGRMPAQLAGQRPDGTGQRRRPARRDGVPDPDGLAGRPGRGRGAVAGPRQEGGRLRGLPRAVVRLGAVGGAGRLLAVHDRGGDRRAGGGRPDRRPAGRRAPRPGSTGPPPTTSSAAIKGWTVTTTGPYATGRYFIRLSKTGDPDAAITYNLGNGGPDADQRAVIDAGFLELTRLGILPADDPDVLASLPVVDSVIRRETASGPGWYRYGTSTDPVTPPAPRTATATATSRTRRRAPRPASPGRPATTAPGTSGRCCPASGPSTCWRSATGPARPPCWRAWTATARASAWCPSRPGRTRTCRRRRTAPTPPLASIGFVNGKPAGSASPLTWAQAQQARLVLGVGAGRPVEQPAIVADRYLRGVPGLAPLTVTAPADGATVETATTTVTGTTAPGRDGRRAVDRDRHRRRHDGGDRDRGRRRRVLRRGADARSARR